jgi:hypothetical protein
VSGRARILPHFGPECLGFIFFEFFSSLDNTGCRRGRTPERSLRQPSRVWLFMPGLSSCLGARVREPLVWISLALPEIRDSRSPVNFG